MLMINGTALSEVKMCCCYIPKLLCLDLKQQALYSMPFHMQSLLQTLVRDSVFRLPLRGFRLLQEIPGTLLFQEQGLCRMYILNGK